MEQVKKLAMPASGLLGFFITTLFAWTIYRDNIPQNVATWTMIMLLDVLGVILAYKDGNKQPYLQIGWTVAATCVVLAIAFGDSPWQWGQTETISLLLCGVATVLWLMMSARAALFAYMAAMYLSTVPLIVDYWRQPQSGTLWVWLWTIVGCALAIYGAPKRDFTYTFVPWAAIVMNGFIALLCIL